MSVAQMKSIGLAMILLLLAGCDTLKNTHTDNVAPLTECIRTIQNNELAALDIAARETLIIEACVKALHLDGCKHAFDDGTRGTAAFLRCTQAHCPRVQEEKLAICEEGDLFDGISRIRFFNSLLSLDFALERPPEEVLDNFETISGLATPQQRQRELGHFLVEARQHQLSREQRAVLGVSAILSAIVFGPTLQEELSHSETEENKENEESQKGE